MMMEQNAPDRIHACKNGFVSVSVCASVYYSYNKYNFIRFSIKRIIRGFLCAHFCLFCYGFFFVFFLAFFAFAFYVGFYGIGLVDLVYGYGAVCSTTTGIGAIGE